MFALDDLMLRPGKCQHQHDYVYTFANGFEDLEMEYIQPIQNGIGRLFMPSSDHILSSLAPSVDHTTNSEQGYYFLFMNSDSNPAPITYIDTVSMLDLPPDSRRSQSCIRFAYQILGNVTLQLFTAPLDSYTYYYRYAHPKWISK